MEHVGKLLGSCGCSCEVLEQELVPVLRAGTTLHPVGQQRVLADPRFSDEDLSTHTRDPIHMYVRTNEERASLQLLYIETSLESSAERNTTVRGHI